jgi:hypothetical protein
MLMLAHLAWKSLCRPAHGRLRAAMGAPRKAQEHVLSGLLHKNAASHYGKHHALHPRMPVRDFQQAVPISTYEDLRPLIERAAGGELNVLTTEPVLMFETSSGSTSAAKLIPYTRSLRSEFQEAIRAWMYDLYASYPAIARGRHYWSITPLHREKRKTVGGIPIGFDDDAEYLGRLEQWLSARLFAVPSSVGKLPDMESCLSATREHLRQAPDLRFISVWSPSFLELLLDGFDESPSQLWPDLAVVSCWGDAASRAGFAALQQRLPGVKLQAKGLLATEGVMTIPLESAGGCVPCLNSHFYEFLPASSVNEKHDALLCDELEEGGEYTLVMTTGGGSWRYHIGDRVRCVRFTGKVPVLEFVGKEDGVSDLKGEKLNPHFVGRALDALRSKLDLQTAFLMLAPADDGSSYILISETPPALSLSLASQVDDLLQENPHYRYCRDLGQLNPVRVVPAPSDAAARYLQRCVALGQRAGDVKPAALHRERGWEAWMTL